MMAFNARLALVARQDRYAWTEVGTGERVSLTHEAIPSSPIPSCQTLTGWGKSKPQLLKYMNE